jgi:hypothetical protein
MKTLFRSFAGGQITPELFSRLDLTKRQTGYAFAENMEVLAHGPLTRRPGFEYVIECKNSAQNVRLIPFEFSVDQSLIIEVGHLYMRFHSPSGTVLEANKAIAAVTVANPGAFTINAHGWSNGDWVFLSSLGGMTALNSAYYIVQVVDANTVNLKRLDGTVLSTLGLPAYTGGGLAARVYTLTTPYQGSDVFGLHFTQANDVVTLVHPSYPAKELSRLGPTNWTLLNISFAPTLPAPTGVSCTATVAVPTNLTVQRYVVTAVDSDGVTESLASAPASDSNNLTLAGNFNTIAWSAVSGASRYKVYKQRGGSYGYIGQTTALTLVDDNVEADTTLTPPEDIVTLNTAPDDYPSAVAYHEQRRYFGGTNAKPQGVWATRTGTGSNLTSSIPAADADGFYFNVFSRMQSRVRHILPLSDLAVLTNSAEWRIFADNAPAITPTTLTVKPTGYAGASNVQPVVTSGSIIYVQAQGSFVRELSYGGAEANYSYRTIDLSVMCPNLFDTFSIVDLAYSRAPDQRVWAVRSDGVLLGMTYVPEQQVYAWHQHTTDGLFKSVACIATDNADVTYAVVERVINGRTVKYIERRRPRRYPAYERAFFVDAGSTYSGPPVSIIRNLWHLEGKTVVIFGDGGVLPSQVVLNGSIALGGSYSVVSVGLASRARVKTLPLALEAAEAGGQGTLKNVNEAFLRLVDSAAPKIGRTFGTLRQYPSRDVQDDYDAAPEPLSQEIAITIDADWNADGSVCIEQELPLPLTITGIALDVETGG